MSSSRVPRARPRRDPNAHPFDRRSRDAHRARCGRRCARGERPGRVRCIRSRICSSCIPTTSRASSRCASRRTFKAFGRTATRRRRRARRARDRARARGAALSARQPRARRRHSCRRQRLVGYVDEPVARRSRSPSHAAARASRRGRRGCRERSRDSLDAMLLAYTINGARLQLHDDEVGLDHGRQGGRSRRARQESRVDPRRRHQHGAGPATRSSTAAQVYPRARPRAVSAAVEA